MAPSDLVRVQRSRPWIDPIDAYDALRAAGQQAYLLLGAGAHPDAGRSYVACSPAARAEVREGRLVMTWTGREATMLPGDAMDALARLWGETTGAPPADVTNGLEFTGGWVGVLGYSFAHALEPSIPAQQPWVLPDARLDLCLVSLAFDHAAGTLTLHAADLHGDTARAQALLDAVAACLAAPNHPAPETAGPAVVRLSLDQAEFESSVRQAVAHIHSGDLFQVNLATRTSMPCTQTPSHLLRTLRATNPAPYMALLDYGDAALVSASPENLFRFDGTAVSSRPIAGTRKRGADPQDDARLERELRNDAKEQAEHTMLVDLVRNDVARVARPGTVRVRQRMMVERYRHVMHLVSLVEAPVRAGTTAADCVRALFPGGTVTGAPKVRACQRIAQLEPVPRGAYTGSAGFVDWSGRSVWSILIRGLVLERRPDGAVAHVHAGSGIVADSDPGREWREAQRKGRALLEAAQGCATAGQDVAGLPVGHVTPGQAWDPPRDAARATGRRVLLVDNYDSFVHNLADYCLALGADVRVVRNDCAWRAQVADFAPTHIVLGPGPGWPDDAGCTRHLAVAGAVAVPVLGVCLGHQAMGGASGATVRTHPAGPVHGRADFVHHSGAGLFAGLPSPMLATRYHSLVVEAPGPEWNVDARLADGTVMAMRHAQAPLYGLQFHPESLCTEHGLELVARFLEVSP